MARNVEINSIDQNNTENANIIKLEAGNDGNISLPTGHFIGDASLSQDGQNLVLEFSEGERFAVEDYFTEGNDFIIEDSNGGILNEGLVNSFLESSPEYAQASSMTDESPVGAVEEIKGSAKVTRADGSNEEITLGTPIYQGDVIQTSDDGAVNIMFVDETSMAISESARIAVDKYEFDAATESGVTDLSVLRGVFVYTSGLIGRDDPDDVTIETPVGSIGIRGTIIAGNINPEGESEISVLEGAIVIANGTGETTLSQQFETVKLSGFQNEIEYKGVEAANDIGKTYGSVSDVLPKLFSSINDTAKEEVKADKSKEKAQEKEEIQEAQKDNDKEVNADEANTEEPANILETGQVNVADAIVEGRSEGEKSRRQGRRNKHRRGRKDKNQEDNKVDEYNAQQADDTIIDTTQNTAEAIINLRGLFEGKKAGTIVGDVRLEGYPAGTSINIYEAGTTDDSNEFSVTQIAGTNRFAIKLENNITGNVGSSFGSSIDIVAILPNGTINILQTETPTIEDAVVNLNRPGGYGYEIDNDPLDPNENEFTISNFDGDNQTDHVLLDPNAGGSITIYDASSNLGAASSFVLNNHNYNSIDSIGDINNDGYTDIIAGTESYNTNTGKVAIIHGGTNPTTSYKINPDNNDNDFFGSSVAGIGDFDGDGKSDFIVGSIDNTDVGGKDTGAAFIYSGVDQSIISHIEGVDDGIGLTDDQNYGDYVDGIGDFNGDGLSDVIIGYKGGVHVVLGGGSIADDTNQDDSSLDNRSFNITGNIVTAGAAGDINGDGFDDFAVSFDDGSNVNTYIIYGQFSDGMSALNDFSIDNANPLHNLENPDVALKIHHADTNTNGQDYQITARGDINGDGFDDIQVGIKNGEQFIIHGQYGESPVDVVTDNSSNLDGSLNDMNPDENTIKAGIDGQSLVGETANDVTQGMVFQDGNLLNISMTGGSKNNIFELSSNVGAAEANTPTFRNIDGGKGIDTIKLTEGYDNFDFSHVNFEQIQGIEKIEFGASPQTITLTAENIFNLLKSSDDGELTITGDLGGTLNLIDQDTSSSAGMHNQLLEVLNEGGVGATHQADADLNGDGNTDHFHYKIGGYDLYIDTDLTTAVV